MGRAFYPPHRSGITKAGPCPPWPARITASLRYTPPSKRQLFPLIEVNLVHKAACLRHATLRRAKRAPLLRLVLPTHVGRLSRAQNRRPSGQHRELVNGGQGRIVTKQPVDLDLTALSARLHLC